MPTPIQLPTISLDSISGKRFSDAVTQNPSKNWLIAPEFKNFPSMDGLVIAPQSSTASLNAAFRWASTEFMYQYRVSVKGLKFPIRATLVKAPAGAYIGTGGLEQTYNISQDPDLPSMYVHSFPTDFLRVKWQASAGDVGIKRRFRVMIEDNDSRIIFAEWNVTTDNSRFMYFDAVNGNDANAGTFALPKQTAAHAYSLTANDKIFVFRDGIYSINSDFALGSTKCKSWLALNHQGAEFNLDAGLFSNDGTDAYFRGIKFTGGRLTAANVRNMWWNTATRLTIDKCTFNPTFVGSVGTDNPSCIFIADGGAGNAAVFKEYVSITDTDVKSTALVELTAFFDVRFGVIENCHAPNVTMPASNGTEFIHLKDGCPHISVRHCTAPNYSSPGSPFTFTNQDAVNCEYQELVYCAMSSASTRGIRWNVQSGKGTNQFAARCTLSTGTAAPMLAFASGIGEPVNVSGMLYATTQTNIATDLTAFTMVGQAHQKVPANEILEDLSYAASIKPAALGRVGHIIASTVVV